MQFFFYHIERIFRSNLYDLGIIAGVGFLVWYFFIAKRGHILRHRNVCVEEQLREAAARAAKAAADRKVADSERARKAAADADAARQQANRDAAAAARAAGGRWSAHGSTDWEGEHIEVHKEGWQNKELGAKADAAAAAARAAKEVADAAKKAYDAAGGDAAARKAKQDAEKADSDWRKAKEALERCLGEASAPKPAPAPPSTPGTTAGGGPTTPPVTPPPTGGTTPPPSGTPPEKKEPPLVCIEGERRNVRTRTENVELLDIQSARLMQDRIYSDAGNEAMKFIDWLQTVKDLFMLGKQVKGAPQAVFDRSITGAADAAGLPDFFTYYDVTVDALTKSMYQLFQIMQGKQQLGDYWLDYTVKRITLTCTTYELCSGNRWVRRCELTIEDHGTATGHTDPLTVHDVRELRGVITRLFNQLKSKFNREKQKAERFSNSCRV